jgi:hypothetical protein
MGRAATAGLSLGAPNLRSQDQLDVKSFVGAFAGLHCDRL